MRILFIIVICFAAQKVVGQELYVFTEPASNMAAKSLGMRIGARVFKMQHENKFSATRYEPEVMIGISKNLMIHLNGYASNMFQQKTKIEGGSVYAKWRFLSKDEVHSHFRMAAFGKIAIVENANYATHYEKHQEPDGNGGIIIHDIPSFSLNKEIELDGTNSGVNGGLVATQLVNKLAISASASYSYRLDNVNYKREVNVPWRAFNYSVSAGYLLLPKEYTSYKQTNVNLYTEFLAQNTWDNKAYFIDAAPAIQFIFNSIAKVDVGYRTQISGNMQRMGNSYFLVRFEYNFLNIFSKK
jgi:hypothetical protein